MCGTALGMACNGMYAFWGPFFIWVILGVLNIGGMSADYPPLTATQWIGAVIMVLGIFVIAVSPARWFGRSAGGSLAVDAGGVASGEAAGSRLDAGGIASGRPSDTDVEASPATENPAILDAAAEASPAAESAVGLNVGAGIAAGSAARADADVDPSLPLYYSILLHFQNGMPDTAAGVVRALRPSYGDSRQLTQPSVAEALATAKENGLLAEVGCDLDATGRLRVHYRITPFGRDMVESYVIADSLLGHL